jgi:hypothetical protein
MSSPLFLAETLTCRFPQPGQERTYPLAVLRVDGPYSSVVLAERALDERIATAQHHGAARLASMLEPEAQDAAGQVSSWRRDLEWFDPAGGYPQKMWQRIRRTEIDVLPITGRAA